LEPESILVVGADADETAALVRLVEASGRSVVREIDCGAAETRLSQVSVAVVDGRSLADSSLADLLRAATEAPRSVPCVLGLASPTVEQTVSWMRDGAFAVVALPADPAGFDLHLRQALRRRELETRNAELERSVETNERLAMIGKLAAGVAHELNNPLDGVLRYVNLTIDKLPKDSTQVTYLMEARRGLRRMADIVRDLLQFSRNANAESTDEDAERLARDAVTQVVSGHAGDRKIATVFQFPVEGVALPRGMFQVFGNLARNALDAMPRGGTLTVATTVATGRVRIEVSDTGTGIPDELRDRVFEPFFTTKEVGKGTGLGLPICLRIVERLGGTLALRSEVGRGTTVAMEMPLRRTAAAAAPAARSAAKAEEVF